MNKGYTHTRATKTARLNWLREHQSVWEGYPREGIPNHDRRIFEAMQRAGLYSPSTLWADCNIMALVGEARRRRRLGQPGYAMGDKLQPPPGVWGH